MARTLTLPIPPDPAPVREAKEIALAVSGPDPVIINFALRLIEDRDHWSNTKRRVA